MLFKSIIDDALDIYKKSNRRTFCKINSVPIIIFLFYFLGLVAAFIFSGSPMMFVAIMIVAIPLTLFMVLVRNRTFSYFYKQINRVYFERTKVKKGNRLKFMHFIEFVGLLKNEKELILNRKTICNQINESISYYRVSIAEHKVTISLFVLVLGLVIHGIILSLNWYAGTLSGDLSKENQLLFMIILVFLTAFIIYMFTNISSAFLDRVANKYNLRELKEFLILIDSEDGKDFREYLESNESGKLDDWFKGK